MSLQVAYEGDYGDGQGATGGAGHRARDQHRRVFKGLWWDIGVRDPREEGRQITCNRHGTLLFSTIAKMSQVQVQPVLPGMV